MIRTLTIPNHGDIVFNTGGEEIFSAGANWQWVDFSAPTEEEVRYLSKPFGFHHLAIEDCLHGLQRPKVDDYGDYRFFVLHSPSKYGIITDEINIFQGEKYIVTFHNNSSPVIDDIWKQYTENPLRAEKGPEYLFYLLVDGLVDQYFPILGRLGGELEKMESQYNQRITRRMISQIFSIRRELLLLRRSLDPFRDVLKSIIHPEDDRWRMRHRAFFSDVHDNLIRLVETTETYRHMGLDLIESHVSLNSQRTNNVMVTLTVITTIFMPLTFIAGIYGMNFDYMPELHWRYGYFSVLFFMGIVAGVMVNWFRFRDWF